MAEVQSMNCDLAKERGGASFQVENVTSILDGGVEKTRQRRYYENLAYHAYSLVAARTPDFRFVSRESGFEEKLRLHTSLITALNDLGIQDEKICDIFDEIFLDADQAPLSLHNMAFKSAFAMQADDEQKNKWFKKIETHQIIGCYAQTELGHGSFVRGLETRADFDEKRQEFIMNTPTLTATKFWSGTMGVCATHALVMAQLYTRGCCHGVHPFLVQIRGLEDHKPLSGIVVGDIGPAFGIPWTDTGFLRLFDVRIPHDHLLGKTGKVSAAGVYSAGSDRRLVYSGMLGLRVTIPANVARHLARGSTIAIRYSCVRRQSELKPGEQEAQVLDFQTQQHKLFPLLAAAYCFHFAGHHLQEQYVLYRDDMAVNDFNRLPELHAVAAGMKAVMTWRTHEGVEMCRLACGGHGYSLASGFPHVYTHAVASTTVEGETTVLLLQTARYLVKAIGQKNKLQPSVKFLKDVKCEPTNLPGELDPQSMLYLLQVRAVRTLEYASRQMGTKQDLESFNKNSVCLTEAAKAFIESVIFKVFVDKILQLENSNERTVLEHLCRIYGLTEILTHAGDHLQSGCLSLNEMSSLREQLFQLYTAVRSDAVALVDAFDLTDQQLANSILGRYDGNVYEGLYNWAKESPLNKDQVHSSYYRYLQPLQQSKL